MSIQTYKEGQFTAGSDDEFVGIGGFTTSAIVSERLSRSASVPVTFLENGTHINDHIIRDPLILSIEGNVSDVFALQDTVISESAQPAAGNITQYASERTTAQTKIAAGIATDFTSASAEADAKIESRQIASRDLGQQDKSAISNTDSFLSAIAGQQASNSLITISTTFNNYTNMYINSFEATKDNKNKSVSFTMELQQLRFADTIFAENGPASNPSSATNGQTEGEKDKGVQEGEEVPESLLFSIKKGVFGGNDEEATKSNN